MYWSLSISYSISIESTLHRPPLWKPIRGERDNHFFLPSPLKYILFYFFPLEDIKVAPSSDDIFIRDQRNSPYYSYSNDTMSIYKTIVYIIFKNVSYMSPSVTQLICPLYLECVLLINYYFVYSSYVEKDNNFLQNIIFSKQHLRTKI